MNQSKILEERINTIYREKLNVEVPSFETDLIDSGLIDSLRLVELLVALEEEFATKFSMDDIEIDHFRSITSIAAFLGRRAPQEPAL